MRLSKQLFTLDKQRLYHLLFEPRSTVNDVRRREFMTCIVLFGFMVITSLRLICILGCPDTSMPDEDGNSILLNVLFLVVVTGLWRLARIGYRRTIALSLLGIITFEATKLTLQSSFESPAALLMYALVLVLCGILLTERLALTISVLVIILFDLISYAQTMHFLKLSDALIDRQPQLGETITYIAILSAIVLVSWLTNREINRSALQAHKAEQALIKERDNLELAIQQRTHQLQESQLFRTMELQHFAEFGRLSASLLHEVTNPLTAASLHLEQLDDKNSDLVTKIRQNLLQLERYINAARRQVKKQSHLQLFSVQKELEQVTAIMQPLAHKTQVKLRVFQRKDYTIYGDPIKFNHVVANLIANALDAYHDFEPLNKTKRIEVRVTNSHQQLQICVNDWGKGISPLAMRHLFRAFYSEKPDAKRGLGIGLTTVKQIIEHDFKGTVTAKSSDRYGTRFIIKITLRTGTK